MQEVLPMLWEVSFVDDNDICKLSQQFAHLTVAPPSPITACYFRDPRQHPPCAHRAGPCLNFWSLAPRLQGKQVVNSGDSFVRGVFAHWQFLKRIRLFGIRSQSVRRASSLQPTLAPPCHRGMLPGTDFTWRNTSLAAAGVLRRCATAATGV